FNESIEASVGARGLVKSVSVVGHNSVGTVVRIQTTSGNTYHYGISNQAEDTQQATHTVEFAGETYSWEGSFAQL
ncbi:chondroitin lyase, partial [Vibrio splendidus]